MTEKTFSVQAQAVLFKNNLASILKSAISLANAAKYAGAELTICYGDASPMPCLNAKDLSHLEHEAGCNAIEYDFFDENTGFGKGQNRMAQSSDSDYLLIINPDIVVSPNLIKEMRETLSDPAAGIVEARQTPIEHPKKYDEATFETDWASGACMMIPRELFLSLGGFDDKTFWMYCEDVDLSWRAKLAGKKVKYQPKAVAFHPKKLSQDAHWMPTETEIHHSALTALLMAYKWSNQRRVEELVRIFSNTGDQACRDALKEFETRKSKGLLADPISAPPNVATFYPDGGYAVNRFSL